MNSDSRLSAAARLCQLSVILLATASTVSGHVDPAGPVITSPPDAGVVYLRDGTQDVSFWGYISESGTWDARYCAAGQTITLSGAYGACKSTAQVTASVATGCKSGSLVVYPSQSASCTVGNQCNTRVLHRDLDDKAGYSMYGCGVPASSSVDLYMQTTGTAVRPTSSSVSSVSASSRASSSLASSSASSSSSKSSTSSSSTSSSSKSTLSTSISAAQSSGAMSRNVVTASDSQTNLANTSGASKTTFTSGAVNPTADSSADNSSSSSTKSAAWIAGPAIGGAIALALIAGLIFWLVKRRQMKRQVSPVPQPIAPPPSYPQYQSPPPPQMSPNSMYQGQHPYQPPTNAYYGNNAYPEHGKFQEMPATESSTPSELPGYARPPEMPAPHYPQGR